MSNTILTKRLVKGKKSIKDTWKISFKNPSAGIQEKDSVRKLHEVIQELTYGATEDAIKKKLAAANKKWMETFYNRLK